MLKALPLLTLIFTLQITTAQIDSCIAKNDSSGSPKIYKIVDQMPEFPGGKVALDRFIEKHLVYPTVKGCYTGSIFVSFIIEANGQITGISIVKGEHESANGQAIAVVKKMPAWNPGICNGEKVPVEIILPIRFSL